MKHLLLRLFFATTFLLPLVGYAQGTAVSGKVVNAQTKEPMIGVNVAIKGTVAGTITNADGLFSIDVRTAPPFKLVVSFVGFLTTEIEVTQSVSDLNVELSEQSILTDEIVVSASRVEESILQSPVTIEKIDARMVRETPAPNFYDALANIKGIDLNTQSITFKSVNMRGFNANGQVRVVQIVDGMDNQAPGLNFSVGNIIGISDLDLDNVEILPGASSALYGPNALNGIILMNSKSPFKYQGLSMQSKVGLMHSDGKQRPGSPLYDFSLRYAKAFDNRYAFKVNFSYLDAQDWQAQDYRDQNPTNGTFTNIDGTRDSNPAYNGINTYGDESPTNLPIGQGGTTVPVSRTGYAERDLVDYNAKNLKGNFAFHYRINDKAEFIYQINAGTGTTVYTGADRYNIRDFVLIQNKLELRGSNFYIRAYATSESSGKSFAAGFLASLINEDWKSSQTWFTEYAGAFGGAVPGVQAGSHTSARAFADRDRPAPGSDRFNQLKDILVNIPIGLNQGGRPLGGAKFQDKTKLYHTEFMYNFVNQIKFVDLTIGANFRQYSLNSGGTLFATRNGKSDGEEFIINEYGGYAQAAKKLINDQLKLTGSFRFDKSQNFDIQYSPRISAVFTFLENHNIRASYQTGFRIPTTQSQYINLITPQARLIGGTPLFQEKTRYNLNTNPAYTIENVTAYGAAFQATTRNPTVLQQSQAQATAIVTQQVQAGQIPPAQAAAAVAALTQQLVVQEALRANASILQPYKFQSYQPEKIQAFEVGYKGLIGNKLIIDAYYYYNIFKNFDGGQVLLQSNIGLVSDANGTRDASNRFTEPTATTPLGLIGLGGTTGQATRSVYSLPVNLTQDLKLNGWAVSANLALPSNFTLTGNISYNSILNESDLGTLQSSWNTPKYRFNFQIGNREIIKNVGFNIGYRWQDQAVWQSTVVQTDISQNRLSIVPSYGTLDAQISVKVPSIKSIFKLGGTNVLNQYYTTAWANPSVGALYYISITFDQLMNK